MRKDWVAERAASYPRIPAMRLSKAARMWASAALSSGVGYACVRFAISAAVRGVQSAQRVPRHDLRQPDAQG